MGTQTGLMFQSTQMLVVCFQETSCPWHNRRGRNQNADAPLAPPEIVIQMCPCGEQTSMVKPSWLTSCYCDDWPRNDPTSGTWLPFLKIASDHATSRGASPPTSPSCRSYWDGRSISARFLLLSAKALVRPYGAAPRTPLGLDSS
jgi:hypothetical protein